MSEKRVLKNLIERKQSDVLMLLELDDRIIFSGSIALNYHGIINRNISDIDIEVSSKDIKSIIEKFKQKGFEFAGVKKDDEEYIPLEQATDEVLSKITQVKCYIERKVAKFDPKHKKVITHIYMLKIDIFCSENPGYEIHKFLGKDIKVCYPAKIFKAKKFYCENYEKKYSEDQLKYHQVYQKHKKDIESYNKWKYKKILTL